MIHDRYAFGGTAEIVLLDDRQYRSRHACLPGRSTALRVDCPDRLDEGRTMLGSDQEAWLDRSLAAARGRWTIVAQQTLMAERDLDPGDGHGYWMDGWDGYPASRRRLLDSIATHRPSNPIVIGGDVHSFWAAELKRDFQDPKGEVLATEFVGTSITSQGPGANAIAGALAKNPHIKYGRGDRRGYATIELTKDRATIGFEAVADEKDARSPVSRVASFLVEPGRPGVNGG